MRNLYLAVGIIVVILVAVAFAIIRNRLPIRQQSTTPTPSPIVQGIADTVSVSKHTPASTTVVDAVSLLKPGFVAIYVDANGQPGEFLGSSELLTSGKHENIAITLSRKTNPGETLRAVVIADNGDGKFEYPGADTELKDQNGNLVAAQFSVEAQDTQTVGQTQIPATGLGVDSK